MVATAVSEIMSTDAKARVILGGHTRMTFSNPWAAKAKRSRIESICEIFCREISAILMFPTINHETLHVCVEFTSQNMIEFMDEMPTLSPNQKLSRTVQRQMFCTINCRIHTMDTMYEYNFALLRK